MTITRNLGKYSCHRISLFTGSTKRTLPDNPNSSANCFTYVFIVPVPITYSLELGTVVDTMENAFIRMSTPWCASKTPKKPKVAGGRLVSLTTAGLLLGLIPGGAYYDLLFWNAQLHKIFKLFRSHNSES
jgi:hypothetical protein